jgi:hypothetical protein
VLRLGALIRGDARITKIEINPLRVYAWGALARSAWIPQAG